MTRFGYNMMLGYLRYGFLVLLVLGTGVRATTIEELGFSRLVAESAAIFVGSVQSHQDREQGALVATQLTFHVEQVLRGPVTGTELKLEFIGGKPGSFGTEVDGQFIPADGSYGVFFINALTGKPVNPLTGWQQGFFPVVRDPAGTFYLDMWQRQDFKVPGLIVDPLATKMRGLGFSQQAIDEKIPKAWLFPLADFVDAIADEIAIAPAVAP